MRDFIGAPQARAHPDLAHDGARDQPLGIVRELPVKTTDVQTVFGAAELKPFDPCWKLPNSDRYAAVAPLTKALRDAGDELLRISYLIIGPNLNFALMDKSRLPDIARFDDMVRTCKGNASGCRDIAKDRAMLVARAERVAVELHAARHYFQALGLIDGDADDPRFGDLAAHNLMERLSHATRIDNDRKAMEAGLEPYDQILADMERTYPPIPDARFPTIAIAPKHRATLRYNPTLTAEQSARGITSLGRAWTRRPDVEFAASRLALGASGEIVAGEFPSAALVPHWRNFLCMSRTPLLLVLASDPEIEHFRLPRYWEAPNVTAEQEPLVSVPQRSPAWIESCGDLTVRIGETANFDPFENIWITTSVVHVKDWMDRTAPDAGSLRALAALCARVMRERAENLTDDERLVFSQRNENCSGVGHPVVHCRGGIGRTGLICAILDMTKPGCNRSLEAIVKQMRTTRNRWMIQTSAQLAVAIEVAREVGVRVFATDGATAARSPDLGARPAAVAVEAGPDEADSAPEPIYQNIRAGRASLRDRQRRPGPPVALHKRSAAAGEPDEPTHERLEDVRERVAALATWM